MKEYSLDIAIEMPFGNLFRKEHALIVVLDNENKVLVGLKPNFLPNGIARLLGGGIKKEELPIKGAARELNEELGVFAEEKDLKEMFKVNLHAVDNKGTEYNTTTYVYLYELKDLPYQASSDVAEVAKLTTEELHDLANTYNNYDGSKWYEGAEGKHKWADYGKLYGPIHDWVCDYLP